MDFVLGRLQALFSGLTGAKQRSEEATRPVYPEPPLTLPKIQVVMARRVGTLVPVHLMVDGMSPDLMLFKTAARMREGEHFELESLLSGVGSVRLKGVVEWLLQSRGGYSGQITLKLDDEQREQVNRFLSLQKRGMRG